MKGLKTRKPTPRYVTNNNRGDVHVKGGPKVMCTRKGWSKSEPLPTCQ